MSIHIDTLSVMIEGGRCELGIKRQLMKFYGNANTLIRVFGKYSNDVKIKLFHTYCTTLYCGIFGMKLQCEILVDLEFLITILFVNCLIYHMTAVPVECV